MTAGRPQIGQGRRGFAVEEVARRHGDFAIAGAAEAVALDGRGCVERAGIGLIGMGSTPLRAATAEAAAVGTDAADAAGADVGRMAVDALDSVPSDLHGSDAYRRRVGAVMVARAWDRAIEEATGG